VGIIITFGLNKKINIMVHTKLKKMLEMLIMLSGKYGRTKEGLSKHFDISQKTIGRYFDTFRDAGFILEKSDNYWKINIKDSNYKDLSQLLHFSQEESHILRNAINSMNAPQNILDELSQKLYSIYNFDRVATPLIKTNIEEKVKFIESSIKNRKRIYLNNYQSSNSSNKKDRLVEAFDFTHNYRSVWAYDCDSKQCKMFVLTRIQEIEITENNWKFGSNHQKQTPDIFRMTGIKLTPIKLKLSLRAKNLLIEEYPLAEEYIENKSENSFLLKTEVYSLEGVGRFIKGLLDDIEILEPENLKNKIIDDLKEYLKK